MAVKRSRLPVDVLADAINGELSLVAFAGGAHPVVAERYKVTKMVGLGASGVVCRAEDLHIRRDVALKLYPPVDDENLEGRTLREAQALGCLDHPNIVRVYDHALGHLVAGRTTLQVYFVSMEFVDGLTLRAWLAESRRSTYEILQVLLKAGEGLCAAHRAGLVHRDFKPENIMIDSDGAVRVVDFGLARGNPGETTASDVGQTDFVSERYTRHGDIAGTWPYMAPEARRGETSAKSDQYSFAAAAWESLTGQLPGVDGSAANDQTFEQFFDRLFSVRPDLNSVSAANDQTTEQVPDLNPRVGKALERALSSDPFERYDELSELLMVLGQVANRQRRLDSIERKAPQAIVLWKIGASSIGLSVLAASALVAGFGYVASVLLLLAILAGTAWIRSRWSAQDSEESRLRRYSEDNISEYSSTGYNTTVISGSSAPQQRATRPKDDGQVRSPGDPRWQAESE